ncbi:protein neprosin-like [Silene latifolia]|uniref:protein neprosin-like n=1 Tax=Silene latifolia TaxID=37657 RepID=UPI003D76BD29
MNYGNVKLMFVLAWPGSVICSSLFDSSGAYNEYGDVYDCVDFYKQPAFDHPQLKNYTSFYPEMRPTSPPINNMQCHRKDYMMLKEGSCPFGTVPIRRIAVLQTNSDPSKVKYSGVTGAFNVYNLPIEQSQYSSGEFVIQNGDDRIKVGWTVNPTLNDDNQVRAFLYTDDGESGNWWLNICGINIGFWPKQIFTKMSESATYIGVGGEAYGPTDRPLPPMGNGYYPVDNNMKLSAFFSDVVYVDENHMKIDHPQIEPYTNDPHYGINKLVDTGLFGHVILYGGINK